MNTSSSFFFKMLKKKLLKTHTHTRTHTNRVPVLISHIWGLRTVYYIRSTWSEYVFLNTKESLLSRASLLC